MRILGIETSCDETAAAVIEVHRQQFTVHSNIVASQIKIHAKTGGVVPEVAARAHVEAILPVVEKALEQAGYEGKKVSRYAGKKPTYLTTYVPNHLDAIAVTAGPGLMTSLLVGVEVARTLSWLWKKPLIGVNHLAGHVYANWLDANGREYKGELSRIEFPLLCLIVSGGHTELVLMRRHMDFKIIGSTRDDAAGEAFDKVAKMLGLPYPGGPAISAMAEKCKMKNEKCKMIKFPRPMIKSNDFDFSFSGLKTSVLYYVRNILNKKSQRGRFHAAARFLPQDILGNICYEFQEAVVDVLVSKTIRAAKQYKVKTVLLGGGVAANARLRQRLVEAIKRELPTMSYVLPALIYTGDNAAMIAAAGYFMAQKKQFTPWQKLDVDPNWELGEKLSPLPR